MTDRVDILLVDDEPRNLDALEAILADPGYRLLRAENADLALRLLLDNRVAAIVLDIKMPGVSGFDLARMIKSTKRFRETPIVFLTAYMVDDQDVIAGYGAGGVDYLTKPVNPDILRQKVSVFAELHRKTRELAELNDRLAELNESLEVRVKERTAELEKSEAALRAAAKQKDEFIAILAHELRNPLAPLRIGLDVLLRHRTPSAPLAVERTLAAMNRQLDHIVRLIDDLLDVSRISRGLLELKRERIDLVPVISAAIENARPLLARRNHVLSIELPETLIAHADATRIAQIVSNLVHNAAKFTPARGSIRVELAPAGDSAVLRVADSGPGIAPDQLERVFDMFVRFDRPNASTEVGLGVGLALARRLAEMHGGTLVASSDGAGHGSMFTLQIPTPALITEPASNGAPAAAPHESAATLDIVVVEDNEDIAQSLEEWLKDLGHSVSIALNGRRGVELIEERRPDLVLCDLGLPELDGLDVCRRIRALPLPHQPMMVALTGWGRDDDRRRTTEAGFDQHLVKPVAAQALHAVLNNATHAGARGASGPEARVSSQDPKSALHVKDCD